MSHWWCLKHDRVETEPDTKGAERLGPFDSAAAAANWRETYAERNEQERREKAGEED